MGENRFTLARRRKRRAFKLVIGAGLCSSLNGCGWYYSTILVDNRTGATIEEVTVTYPNERAYLGRVPAGKRTSYWFHFPGEASGEDPRLSFVVNGRRRSEQLCYHTGFSPFDATVTVTDAEVTVRCH